ncbi:hypothetical protein ABH912_001238 [Pseudomonas sp. BT76 TE3572]
MSIPIPAETPDPNIDSPTIPSTEPEPVPEQDPPGTAPPPREEPPSTMPPVVSHLRGIAFQHFYDLRHHAEDSQRQQRAKHRRRLSP